VKRITVLVSVLMGLLLSGISDTRASIADTSIPDDKVTSCGTDNSDSASAMITITWTTAPLNDE